MKKFILTLLAASVGVFSSAQSIRQEIQPVCDSLATLIRERTSVDGPLTLKSVSARGQVMSFYFDESLGDFPWKAKDVEWFRKELYKLLPRKYQKFDIGEIYSKKVKLSDLVTPGIPAIGYSEQNRFRVRDPRGYRKPVVTREGDEYYTRGLTGRSIALWQSHGYYFEQKLGRWEWQRAALFQTVEDLFTQTYVLPFLVPMLENAGANVFLPRERDFSTTEIICDNDASFKRSDAEGIRLCGNYTEEGKWKLAGSGFADISQNYAGTDNPFTFGTSRMAACTASGKSSGKATAKWSAQVPQRGQYAVYISYKSLENSTKAAHYQVHHLGGTSDFTINQTISGGTWVYLGTFEFSGEALVTLDNVTPKGHKYSTGSVITADAVKIGGGMGNIARGLKDSLQSVSGLPRFTEGARYWMQWAGVPSEVWSQNEDNSDYRDDFMSRGAWVKWLCAGSEVNPEESGLGIPCDLSFAWHSDAGVYPNDSIVGTLAIYTLRSDNSRKFVTGEDRMTQREYADIVQTQLVNDVRRIYDTQWTRRYLWDRSYSESRTPGVPAMLLEFLSHQNFADMRYGLDPSFRFAAARSVYKGMLKYLSDRYGCSYCVQPLPVRCFSAAFNGEKVRLSWKERVDSLEHTAKAEKYMLYTRLDDGAFDNGHIIDINKSGERIYVDVPVIRGHVCSYRIVAVNRGGKSFPSETLAVGVPENAKKDKVLIVNNFTRVSPPAWFDSGQAAGFVNSTDSGVPYMFDTGFIGEMYEYRRDQGWVDDDRPGFGACYSDRAGQSVAGNSFDYPYVHGKCFFDAGYAFCSCSSEAFCELDWGSRYELADIICGKQISTSDGPRAPIKYEVFGSELRKALTAFTSAGGNVLISGSNIGTDIHDSIYQIHKDKDVSDETAAFAADVLGYRWMTNYASRLGKVKSATSRFKSLNGISFCNCLNDKVYCVETPDGLVPAGKNARTILRYADNNISAGVAYNSDKGYKVISLGFPIETLNGDGASKVILAAAEYLLQ